MTDASSNTEPRAAIDAREDIDPPMDVGIQPTTFRLPADIALGHVVLRVADLDRSLEYYGNTLGLRKLSGDDNVAVLGTHGVSTPLVELRAHAGARPARQQGQLGLYHFAILLPDRAALGRFVQHLSNIGARAGASDHLVSEAIYLRDPDGLGIEVYADRPRSSWRAAARQIEMATNPLDFDSVIRAANGEPWTGMPSGTRMGHVHLHVGNLEDASAFYHEALGFDKMVWSYPGALFLAAGGYHHHLGLNTWAGAGATPPVAGDARLIEWRIVTSKANDARAAADSLGGAGYATSEDAGGWLAADPWGTTLRIQPRT